MISAAVEDVCKQGMLVCIQCRSTATEAPGPQYGPKRRPYEVGLRTVRRPTRTASQFALTCT
jgi:hypothetical protein